MPLLASGAQKFSKKLMLQQLVKAAIHWMEAGLPLRCLKIVLLQSDPANTGLILLFKSMKDTYYKGTMEKQKEHSDEYDIYLSYSEEDKKYTSLVIDCLKRGKNDIRIFSSLQELNTEESWQEQLYDTITSCRRVMALISPSYLSSTTCTEQYNIALCHSRKLRHSVLIPLYLADVPYMPTYMGITQYIDCRVNDEVKIASACVTVISRLGSARESFDQEVIDRLALLEPTYDVFLSYSHFDEDIAKKVIKELQIYQPDIKVFIDTAELRAGGAWQQALYEALDRSQSTIALISNHYLRSKVCIEELSLAVALQCKGDSKVWPITIEPLVCELDWLNLLSPVELTPGRESSVMSCFCQNIARDLREPTSSRSGHSDGAGMASLIAILEDARNFFQSESLFTPVLTNGLMLSQVSEQDGLQPFVEVAPISSQVDIYIITSKEDAKYCQVFGEILISHNQSLIIKKSFEENNSTRLNLLESARLIISLLSRSFINCTELVHELNIAWCRQRYAQGICFLAVSLDYLPDKPTYVHLLPCFFHCKDKMWKEVLKEPKGHSLSYKENLVRSNRVPREALCCFASTIELLLGWMKGNDCFIYGLHDRFTNYLHLTACVQRFKEDRITCEQKKACEKTGSDAKDH